ncbi:hypothetical protein DFR86_10640 [Acidianus sulfidivorans JP7]|uniref:Uncharacterized protein n=1 Tax=Acidianus sulfidivorans JP7 TaxID=619593 RepID=A0A2U9IPP2_9CREN|nr:hypothetical protein [Acidianus sulfidivorans]AWR97946.1 hypothetical protein DFR86_10640 [Acidianus sulfidivorans JP7]
MNKDIKIFVILVVFLFLLSILGTYEATKVIIKPASDFNPPYAKVTNAWVENGKIIVQIQIIKNGYNISLTGGYVEIQNTGQKENITSHYTASVFNVSFPLLYNITTSQLSVEGLLEGKLASNPIYITFSGIVSVSIINEIELLNFTYQNNVLHLYIKVFSPLNMTLRYIEDLSIVNYNLSRFVATTSFIPLNISLSPGIHFLNLSFNLTNFHSNIYYSSFQKYTYYVKAYVGTTIYYNVPQNDTFEIYCMKSFG